MHFNGICFLFPQWLRNDCSIFFFSSVQWFKCMNGPNTMKVFNHSCYGQHVFHFVYITYFHNSYPLFFFAALNHCHSGVFSMVQCCSRASSADIVHAIACAKLTSDDAMNQNTYTHTCQGEKKKIHGIMNLKRPMLSV